MYCSDLLETSESARFVQWNGDTLNTPFKAGLTDCQEGFALCYGNWNDHMTVIAFAKNSNKMWGWSKASGNWVEYATKNDLSKIGSIKYVFIEYVNGNSIMEVVKNSYNAGKIPYNSAILGMISYSGMWGISGYTYPTGQNYCSFILHKYDSNEIIHVRNENGIWSVT